MEYEIIEKKINDIIYETLHDRINYEDITPEKHLIEDLGVESSEILEIFLTIMTEFNVEIDRNKLMEITNLKGLYKYIEELATKTNRI